MSTRSLVCVVKNNEYKVAQYCHWDGYPTALGLSLLKFLRNGMRKDAFEKKLTKVILINDDEHKDTSVCETSYGSYDLNILKIIQNTNKTLKLRNELDFAKKSNWCEWGYVVDLDKNTFEIYKGINKTRLNKDDRFYFLQSNKRKEYYPIKCMTIYSIDNLPSQKEFINYFQEIEMEHEE